MRSDWGLLGSNMSSDGMLKLAPRDGQQVVDEIQRAVYEETGKRVEIIIYGDGAYKDPSTGIYELADPETVVAATQGLADRMRCGVKYKYIADLLYAQGKDAQEIERYITSNKEAIEEMEMASEGTTPRQLKDILASLADLISGSSDAGTPLVLIKGINGK
jgi:F420-0:gamma-glutamyl ligase